MSQSVEPIVAHARADAIAPSVQTVSRAAAGSMQRPVEISKQAESTGGLGVRARMARPEGFEPPTY